MTAFTRLGAGLSLKAEHFAQAHACSDQGVWFEVHPENYMVEGPRLAWLMAVGEVHPLSLHSVSLSLAGATLPDPGQLRRLAALVRRIRPALVSEHLAWSSWQHRYLPDLLPFPRTTEALQRIADNVQRTQEAIGQRIAIENPSHYLALDGHEFEEVEFLTELSRRTGCGLLLDVNNLYLSARNLEFDAQAYLDRFPAEAIMEVHLAGHSPDAASPLLIDSHDAPVADAVWALFARLIARIGPRPTLIERDDLIPPFAQLQAERAQAQRVLDTRVPA